jgi:hypothetical protein
MVISDLTRLRFWFASYVSRFFTGSDELDRVFKLKQMHTQRVCLTIRRLASALELSPRNREGALPGSPVRHHPLVP